MTVFAGMPGTMRANPENEKALLRAFVPVDRRIGLYYLISLEWLLPKNGLGMVQSASDAGSNASTTGAMRRHSK